MSDVTIVIPNYNGIAFLKTCLDSVLAQTGVQMDVIIIDNGSVAVSYTHLDVYKRQAYKAYVTINRTIPLILIVVMVANLYFDTGMMAVVVLALVWMLAQFTYTGNCVKTVSYTHLDVYKRQVS